ncbi:hypothetical protein PHYPSEUDO_004865 [Phytophthora pseudosyringae]|uniref:Elicitin n=1 Tax=Phytophthora pseudosyringae TaxID=221518 RepID=A0A8T1VSJ9_9STRA|nr:hypothetical protein PHYPSEUDO_004865 [Phytophthora pseudosyringae]
MKMTRSTALGFLFAVTSMLSSFGRTVTITEVNESSGCTERGTAIYSIISEYSCTEAVKCTTEAGWSDTVSSEYKLCNYDRAGYLRYAFAKVQYLLFEYYEDEACKNLMQSSVILADGKCHRSVHYNLMSQVDEEGTMYVLSRGIDCGRGTWSNFTEPVPKRMINTGECFVSDHTIAKVYLVNGSAPSPVSTSGTTSTTKAPGAASTTTSSSLPLILKTASAALVLSAASTFVLIF